MTFTELSRPPISTIKPWQKHWENRANLPTMYDLPSEDPEEPGLPDEFHDHQPALLSETFKLQDYDGENSFSAADLNLYYDADNNWYKRPDWFGVLGKPAACESNEMRMSYVVWQEGISPFVVVELISPGTEKEDFGRTTSRAGKPPTKWTVYERILQIPYYIIYDRYADTLSGFQLVEGRYQPIKIGAERKIWLPEANAGLSLWEGKYKKFTRKWLRWYNKAGWILTDKEEQEQQIVESQEQIVLQQEQLLAEQAAKEKAQAAEAEAKVAEAEAKAAEAEAKAAEAEAQAAEAEAQREAEAMRRKNKRLQEKLKALGIEMDDLNNDDAP